MINKIKFFVSLLVLLLIVYSCDSNKSEKDKANDNKTNKTDPIKTEPKDQYRIAENFEGSKNQIIDLIEGPATFDITYQGDSHFNATLKYGDGTTLAVLADVDGNYKSTKQITVPKTAAYIIDVTCKGTWSIFRK